MIKQTWSISSEEKIRILQLHESATKNLYLINEQTPPPGKVKVGEKKTNIQGPTIDLTQNFKSGYHSINYLPKKELEDKLSQIVKWAQQNQNPQFTIQIEVGESQVPNRNAEKLDADGNPVKLDTGQLAKLRGITIRNFLNQYFKNLANQGIVKMPKIPQPTTNVEKATQKYLWDPDPNWTAEERKSYVKSPEWEEDQYIRFIVSVNSKNTEDIYDCLVDLTIDLSYNSERDPTNQFPCRGTHDCGDAKFEVYLNEVLIGIVDLSNSNCGGCSKDGKIKLKQEIVRDVKNARTFEETQQMQLILVCRSPNCHSSVQEVKIVDRNNQTLFHACLGAGDERGPKKVTLLVMDECGAPVYGGYDLASQNKAQQEADEAAKRKTEEDQKAKIQQQQNFKNSLTSEGLYLLQDIYTVPAQIQQTGIEENLVKFKVKMIKNYSLKVSDSARKNRLGLYESSKSLGSYQAKKNEELFLKIPMNKTQLDRKGLKALESWDWPLVQNSNNLKLYFLKSPWNYKELTYPSNTILDITGS